MVAQELVLNYPEDVRKLMLVGTGPRGGPGMQEQKPHVVKALTDAGPDPKSARPFLFFSHSANGQAAAQQFMARTAERKADHDPGPSMQTMQAQGEALGEWGLAASHADFMSRLAGLKHSALVAHEPLSRQERSLRLPESLRPPEGDDRAAACKHGQAAAHCTLIRPVKGDLERGSFRLTVSGVDEVVDAFLHGVCIE
jgi:pimeloyl-ACP methyl ester carboxylesterase